MRYFRLLKSFVAVATLSLAAVHAYADKPAVIRIGVACGDRAIAAVARKGIRCRRH
jgi:hypothetical protein